MLSTVDDQPGECVTPYAYRLYGLWIRSQWPLSFPAASKSGLAGVDLFEGSPALFSEALEKAGVEPDPSRWDYYARLSDGTEYVWWNRLFEFLVSPNGRQIAGRPLAEASWAAFETYLFGQVLSYALIKLGIEPLHATVVVIDGSAVGFLGRSGYGKSSLAAAFLNTGHTLLTDDLLVLRKVGNHFSAHPGPPRIKLFPEIAEVFLGNGASGAQMNPYTCKLVIPLSSAQISCHEHPLKAIYVLKTPPKDSTSRRITVRTRTQREALLDLVSNTFNTDVMHPGRLAQQFGLISQLLSSIPFRTLSYPPDLARLPEVVKAVRRDLARGG